MARWLFAVIFVVFSLGGCAMFERFLGGDDIEKSPAELMTEGMESMERGSYTAATEAFQNLKDRYPYSKLAVTAELKMADALYERELYNEAFDAYDEFERLHPKHMTIPYVIYRKGMCHFSQVSTIDRSQSNTHEAKSQFERLVRKFPGTEYANKARRKIRECYISLAEYELCVGHFYYKMKKYHAAMRRYQYLLTNYPDLGQYHEALEYLGKCKQKIAEEQKES